MGKYLEKLKDPRWQKLRLEVFKRDKWTCRICFSKEKTLHLHHISYTKENPWEEPIENLRTLCESCHSTLHNKKEIEDIKNSIIDVTNDSYTLLYMYNAVLEKMKNAKKFTKQKVG